MTDLNITISLSPDEIKIAIAEYISNKLSQELNTNLTASMNDVSIDVGTEYEDRPGGSGWPALKGADVKLKKVPPYMDR